MPGWLTVGRPGRSTVAVSGRPGRSTDVHRMCTQPCWGGRSTGSVDQGHFQRAEALWRSTVLVDRPISLAACTFCARRSTEPIDCPLLRSIGPVDRQSASPANIGLKNLSFYYQLNPIKSHKFHKNQFMLYL